MSIENIERRIAESAEAEATKTVREAEEEAHKRLDTAKSENEERTRQAAEQTRATLQQRLDQAATSERAVNRLKLLAHKAAILDEVFDAAVDRFIGERDGPYREWLAAQLDAVAGETGTILPAPDDRKAIESFLSKHKRDGLALADEDAPVRGGFLLRGERVDFDLSLDARLVELKTDLLPKLAERAFATAEHG